MGEVFMKNTIKALLFILVFTMGALSQETDTAYVPFVVNVNATISAVYADGTFSAVQQNAGANNEVTLALPIPRITTPVQKIVLNLPTLSYKNAEITLHSLDGKLISQRNISAGVYLLSIKGANGNAFISRLFHKGGNLYSRSHLAKEAADGDWTIIVSAAGYIDTMYMLHPVSGTNSKQLITLHDEVQIIDSPMPVFGNVTVHDPSIFMVNDASSTDKFRIIGSFLASAKTGDFMKWTLEQSGGGSYPTTLKYYPKDNSNASVQTVAQQREDVLKPTTNDGFNFFASDIHRMPSGKFYHYYSMTSTWKSSAIGVAIADNADGNYVTQGLFVRSAEAGNNKSPDGVQTWASNAHPNCIDPQAFFDKDGNNFYMVYGSWSGGIFIFEMDVNTGLPKTGVAMNAENGGYGRKLIANNHSGIEAPYILYSPESDYYYLFTSFGGLASDGGYNMRIFRSRFPYGPYEDATHPITTSDPNPLTKSNLTTSTFANYGVKIIGGYQFAQLAGEKTLANNNIGKDGFLSPGHNSAYYDPATGKYFLIHHTRFVGRGEEHQVRVREMFVNEDGWLVAAPFRYDGGTVRIFPKAILSGTWKILYHGRDNNTTVAEHTSKPYIFNADGSVSGTGTGTWELGEDRKSVHISIDGVLYKGVFLRSYDEYHAQWVNTFTALSPQGIAIWGASLSIP
jgi:arabinan endo-1,5-alpha-L-arabinosidase